MKIREARTTVVGTPWRELVFLELTTDDGLVGVSEVRMVNKTDTLVACIGELAPRYVVGTDPFDVERLAWNIQRAEYGRPGEVTQSALAAFDVACWDLMGQSLGVPVWKLLGGKLPRSRARVRQRLVPGRARSGGDRARWRAGRGARLSRAQAGSVRRGQRRAVRPPSAGASIAIVAAVREAVGPDVQIMVEMHGRFTPATAVRVAALLEPYDPEWIEEPVPPENAAALARVRSGHADADRHRRARPHDRRHPRVHREQGLVDVVQVDLTHFGGFLPMKRLAGWADAYYLLLAPHNVCGPVGTMANVHFAVATPNYKVLEHFNDFADPWVQELVDDAPRVDADDGCFALPERPGLGVRLESRGLRARTRAPAAACKLFEAGWEKRGESADIRKRRRYGLKLRVKPTVQKANTKGHSAEPSVLKATRKSGGIARRCRDRRSATHAGAKRRVNRAAAEPDGDVAGVEGVARANRIDGRVAPDVDPVHDWRRARRSIVAAHDHFARASHAAARLRSAFRVSPSRSPSPPFRPAPRARQQQIAALDERPHQFPAPIGSPRPARRFGSTIRRPRADREARGRPRAAPRRSAR